MNKRLLISLCVVFKMVDVFSQTNTFPTSGNVGVGTLTPTSLFQVNGGISQFGGSIDFAKFAVDGDLSFGELPITLFKVINMCLDMLQTKIMVYSLILRIADMSFVMDLAQEHFG